MLRLKFFKNRLKINAKQIVKISKRYLIRFLIESQFNEIFITTSAFLCLLWGASTLEYENFLAKIFWSGSRPITVTPWQEFEILIKKWHFLEWVINLWGNRDWITIFIIFATTCVILNSVKEFFVSYRCHLTSFFGPFYLGC